MTNGKLKKVLSIDIFDAASYSSPLILCTIFLSAVSYFIQAGRSSHQSP